MASKMNITILVLVIIILVTLLRARTVKAQSDCTNVLIGMAPCLNYVGGSSTTPSAQCCSQLASVVRLNPRCLCTVLNGGGASLGVSINQTLALALPGACNVQTPPVSRCNAAVDGPDISPVGTPEALPGDESAGSGSRAVPSTGSSKAIIINTHLQLLLSFLFVASYAFTATTIF